LSCRWEALSQKKRKLARKKACLLASKTTSKEEVSCMYHKQMPRWALCLRRFPQHPTHIQNNDMSTWHYFIMKNI
jgi:hypothetical protein